MFRKWLIELTQEHPRQPWRFASLGAGNCDLEISLAKALRAAGRPEFVIDCFELNPSMLERARRDGAELSAHLNFVAADLNDWRPGDDYDAIIANQSLHHVLNLEGLIRAVRARLRPEGLFLVSDMIGRNGHRRWPEALAIVREFWRKLPPSYRFNRTFDWYEEQYLDWDCSVEGFEGIRAQDILPLLVNSFEFRLFIGFGNAIDPFIDRSFGVNFDADAEWDRAFVDAVHKRDEEEMTAGRIKPTHLIAVMGGRPTAPLLYHPPLSPRFCIRDPTTVEELGSDTDVDPYDWEAWPRSAERELQAVCRLLKSREPRVVSRDRAFQGSVALGRELQKELEVRTEWALRLRSELEERTAWALRLDKETGRCYEHIRQTTEDLERIAREFELRTKWALQLDGELESANDNVRELQAELERLAWAKPLDRRFHRLLAAMHRAVRAITR